MFLNWTIISFLFVIIVSSIRTSNVLGLKLIDLLIHEDNAQVEDSHTIDSGSVTDMVDSLSDEITDEKTSEPTIMATSSSPTMNPTFRIIASQTTVPTKFPISASAPTCSLEVEEYQLKLFWESGMEWQETTKEWAWYVENSACAFENLFHDFNFFLSIFTRAQKKVCILH